MGDERGATKTPGRRISWPTPPLPPPTTFPQYFLASDVFYVKILSIPLLGCGEEVIMVIRYFCICPNLERRFPDNHSICLHFELFPQHGICRPGHRTRANQKARSASNFV